MRRVVGDIEEERLLFVAIDERDRFARERLGEEGGLVDRLAAAQHRIDRVAVLPRLLGTALDGVDAGLPERIEIEIAAVQEPEVLVEATRHRMLLLVRAEVPLADHAGGVAALLEVERQHALVERRAETFLGRSGDAAGVELVAEALLVAARHQAGA